MKTILLAENTLREEELDQVANWIRCSSRLTMGPLTASFEDALSEYFGGGHALFVNSGSSANLLTIYALNETHPTLKGRIIAPAISWATTISPAMQFGMSIHLCDCDRTNLGLDLNYFEDLCKKNGPSLVIIVHVLGHSNSMRELIQICEKYGMLLIEDACEALGSSFQGRKLGLFGAAGTYSFYYGHQMSTIEGGAIVVRDRSLYNVIKSMRAHGWARDVDPAVRQDWENEFSVDQFRSLYTFYHPGFNCRPTDLHAFLGLSQLERMNEVVKVRERNYEQYRAALQPKFWIQQSDTDALCSFAFGTLVSNRLEVSLHLRSKGIESRPLICGSIGRQPFWMKRYGETRLPNADIVHDEGIYLPNHASLLPAEIDYVARSFLEVAIPSSKFS